MELFNSMEISSMGMKAQGSRIRLIAQNIANSDTMPLTADQDPYRRKMMSFKNVLDKETGADLVTVDKVMQSDADFKTKFMPEHPAADENGLVKMPNVDTLVEMMDMREAQRSYEANMGMMRMTKSLLQSALDLLRG